MQVMPLADLLTTRQVAEQLGLTVRQVHSIIDRGDLTPVGRLDPPRGAFFFAPADVDALAADLAEATS